MNTPVRLKENPNDFVQVTRGHLKDLRSLARRSPAAQQVLLLLTERMNRGNAVVISQATIAQILGYTRSTVNLAVRVLESERWMQIIKIGQVNGYVLNSKVLWRDHSGKRYAGFYANVIASESEQSHPIEDWDSIELRNVPVLMPSEFPVVEGEVSPPDQLDLLPPGRDDFLKTKG